jgi:hypothetical protein
MANGILVPVVDFTGIAEDEFNDWYDFEHIPERLRVPGFLACERWIGADSPKISVATYELENADVVKSAAYNAVGNHARGGDNLSVWSKRVTARVKIPMRFEGEQILPDGGIAPKGASALLLNAMSVAQEHEHEFNECTTPSTFQRLLRFPEPCARVAAEPAPPRSATSRSIISRRPMYLVRRHGKRPPIRRGPNGCGRTSATSCGS